MAYRLGGQALSEARDVLRDRPEPKHWSGRGVSTTGQACQRARSRDCYCGIDASCAFLKPL